MDISNSDLIALVGLGATVVGLLITIIKEWKYIVAAFQKLQAWIRPRFAVNISRRNFVISISTITGLLVTGALGRLIYKSTTNDVCSGDELPNELVLNKKNGVVHHKKIPDYH